MEYITHSPEETEALGAKFALSLHPGDVVAFSGDLGAGKTAFTRGVLRGLGYTGRVTSPTFALVNHYRSGSGDSTADVDEIEGNPWFFAQTLFPAASD